VPLDKGEDVFDAGSEQGDVAEQPEKLDGADKHQDARDRHVGPPPSAAAARTARLGAPEDEATTAGWRPRSAPELGGAASLDDKSGSVWGEREREPHPNSAHACGRAAPLGRRKKRGGARGANAESERQPVRSCRGEPRAKERETGVQGQGAVALRYRAAGRTEADGDASLIRSRTQAEKRKGRRLRGPVRLERGRDTRDEESSLGAAVPRSGAKAFCNLNGLGGVEVGEEKLGVSYYLPHETECIPVR
jgi:hypothetical protein